MRRTGRGAGREGAGAEETRRSPARWTRPAVRHIDARPAILLVGRIEFCTRCRSWTAVVYRTLVEPSFARSAGPGFDLESTWNRSFAPSKHFLDCVKILDVLSWTAWRAFVVLEARGSPTPACFSASPLDLLVKRCTRSLKYLEVFRFQLC